MCTEKSALVTADQVYRSSPGRGVFHFYDDIISALGAAGPRETASWKRADEIAADRRAVCSRSSGTVGSFQRPSNSLGIQYVYLGTGSFRSRAVIYRRPMDRSVNLPASRKAANYPENVGLSGTPRSLVSVDRLPTGRNSDTGAGGLCVSNNRFSRHITCLWFLNSRFHICYSRHKSNPHSSVPSYAPEMDHLRAVTTGSLGGGSEENLIRGQTSA